MVIVCQCVTVSLLEVNNLQLLQSLVPSEEISSALQKKRATFLHQVDV